MCNLEDIKKCENDRRADCSICLRNGDNDIKELQRAKRYYDPK